MNEFELIQAYFSTLASKGKGKGVELGIGDDCAILNPPANSQLVVSTDTLIAGVHFPESTSAFDVGFKSLAVNLSDLAAMGASPLWFTLCITLPDRNTQWIEGFCNGMAELIQQTGIQLVGGDTTKGPLSISIHVTGAVPTGEALTRYGACVGDDVYVSGVVGHGAAGLKMVLSGFDAPDDERVGTSLLDALQRFNRPQPRLALGQALRGIATSCIDISDGLFADLQHVLSASEVGVCLELESIPVSDAVMVSDLFNGKDKGEKRRLACNAGDDYELCFTASEDKRESVGALAAKQAVKLTRIGSVVEGASIVEKGGGQLVSLGYQHF